MHQPSPHAIRHFAIHAIRIALILAGSLANASLFAAPPENKPATNSLDDQLRKSLTDDLLKDLPVAPPKATENKTSPAAPAKPKSALDSKLLDQLGDGEDLELRRADDPLKKIGKQMRQVESLIEQQNTSAQTQEMQRQIVTDLDALIKQLQQQCQASGSKKPGSGSGQQSDQSGAGNKKITQQPARESTTRVDKGTAKLDGSAEMQKLIKEIWGHLPARVREQMQNATDEQFLPKYEKLIEEYYRRLAEQGRATP